MATKNMRRAVMQTTRRGRNLCRSAALDDRDASRGAPLMPGAAGASLGAVFIAQKLASPLNQPRILACLPFTCRQRTA